MKSHSFFLCQKERMYLDELGEKKKKTKKRKINKNFVFVPNSGNSECL